MPAESLDRQAWAKQQQRLGHQSIRRHRQNPAVNHGARETLDLGRAEVDREAAPHSKQKVRHQDLRLDNHNPWSHESVLLQVVLGAD